MSEWAAKVFWSEVATRQDDGGWSVLLDGRILKTPAKAPLALPTAALADLVAEEWRAQKDHIDPTTMPATRMANSAVDKVMHQHQAVADHLAAYAETDLLCHRADSPEALVQRQTKSWDPLLNWAKETYGAQLFAGVGVMPVEQNAESLDRLRSAVRGFDAFGLAALSDLVSLSGSLIIGLAVSRSELIPEHAWELSRIDEQFQLEQWGEDEEAAAVAARKRADFLLAHRFLLSASRRAG